MWTLKSIFVLRWTENVARRLFSIQEIVYYLSRKRELNRKLISECRCDERLKGKDEGSTRLITLEIFCLL